MRFGFRVWLTALIAVGGLAIGGLAAAAGVRHRILHGKPSALTEADARRLSAGVSHRTIIIFKNQFPNLPARGATVRARIRAAGAAQAGVLGELRRVHASYVHGFQIINAISATIASPEIKRLQANPAIRAVVPDAMVYREFASLGSGPGPRCPRCRGAARAPRPRPRLRSRSARATRPSRWSSPRPGP